MSDAVILETRDLHAGYGTEAIVRDVSVQLAPASITTIVGSNGAGKSTLLKAMYGLNTHIAGEIHLNGEPIHTLSPSQRFARGLGFVPQGRCNFSLMTVQENLDLGGYTLDPQARAIAMESMFDIFPVLRNRRKVLAGNLSGGEQQLMEMAMVMMTSPKVLLLDEPSIGLSPINLGIVLDNIQKIRDRGVTVMMVEQNVKGALSISDTAIVMELGQVVTSGPAAQIWNDEAISKAYLGRRVEA
jgi:branched-chain amino acid transport system ATP-binding protein